MKTFVWKGILYFCFRNYVIDHYWLMKDSLDNTMLSFPYFSLSFNIQVSYLFYFVVMHKYKKLSHSSSKKETITLNVIFFFKKYWCYHHLLYIYVSLFLYDICYMQIKWTFNLSFSMEIALSLQTLSEYCLFQIFCRCIVSPHFEILNLIWLLKFHANINNEF